MPTLPERAHLLKLYYRNSENAAAAVRKFRRHKKQRRGPISDGALEDMMVKFEKTGQQGVLPGRGQKRVNIAVVKNIVVETSSESFFTELSA
ncbi:hypothetical protein TNCV_1459351 [Trichonephila clavipes]|nr:hypothetical protein TNCV_1459351 [Trichonephila clavipes]